MKTNKSPESETTPSKKKLKQARLPFKLISEGSPTPITPQTRKRKLSATEAESVTKVGKISKENDLVESLVVISDEDSKDGDTSLKEDKSHNPLVKLVDTAWKKKLQKAKGSKKRKNSKKTKVNGPSKSNNESANYTDGKESEDCEMMEVDNPTEIELKMLEPDCDIVVLEDSNNSTDVMGKNESENAVKTNDIDNNKQESEKTESKGNKCIDEKSPEKSESIIKEEPPTKDTESPKKSELSPDTLKESNTGSKSTELIKETSTIEKAPTVTHSFAEKEMPDKAKDTEEISVTTPKRSARNKAKVEQNNNSKGSPSSSQLNDSVCSTPTTPKQTRSSSITNNQDESMNESTTSVKLTPKQIQKKLESAKKKEEKEKERIEREIKRQQDKEERAKQRQEKEDQKKKEREEKEEAKKRERDEKEEQRKKEKDEKDRQKELEKKQREEKEEQKKKEKEEKEEQKRKEKEAREEEKRKRQEALELEKQEQELKKKKAAEAFVNFFVPKQKSEKDQATIGPVSKNSMLSSFTIKIDMRLAPTVRVDLSEQKREELDDLLDKQDASESNLYLKSLREGKSMPMSSGKTWPMDDKDDDDVMIVEDELPPALEGDGEIIACDPAPREKLRPKLFSFHANRRPPYWGTWRKKSLFVKPRKPFGQDEKQLDYEVDSDEEWEEEQEGESIDGSAAGSDDEQDADEYEVDNEVFVPHGYLSDEEATMDEDDVLSLSPDAQKARLKVLEDEFEFEMKKPTEKLKPRLYGLLWENSDGAKPEKCVDAIWNYFGKLSMIMNDPLPLLQPSNEPEETEKKKVKKKKIANDGEQNSPKNEKKKKAKPTKSDEKEIKPPKADSKKNTIEIKKNQPGINMFLTKLKSA